MSTKTKSVPAKNKKKAPVKVTFKTGESVLQVISKPLEIFDNKGIDGEPSRMKEGTKVKLTKLADIGPTGTNIFRVKKDNTNRIFYTISEKLKKAI